MNHATIDQLEEIYEVFRQHVEYFPHVRKDYLRRTIEAGKCIYEDGVVITYNIYSRKQRVGDFLAEKGDCILHQIANKYPGSGKAKQVIERFFEYVDTDVVLSVRKENPAANKFYQKLGFKKVSDITWAKGKLQGNVYLMERKGANNES